MHRLPKELQAQVPGVKMVIKLSRNNERTLENFLPDMLPLTIWVISVDCGSSLVFFPVAPILNAREQFIETERNKRLQFFFNLEDTETSPWQSNSDFPEVV